MFNTLRYAKMLEEVGFSREQSETSIKILVEIMEDKLASKQDLQDFNLLMKQDLQTFEVVSKQNMQEFKAEIKQDMQEFKAEIKQDMQEFKAEIKQDIKDLETRVDTRFELLNSEIRHSAIQVESKITQAKSDLTIRMGTMLAASIAILTAIQKLI